MPLLLRNIKDLVIELVKCLKLLVTFCFHLFLGDTQMTVDSVAPGTGIDLEFDTDGKSLSILT